MEHAIKIAKSLFAPNEKSKSLKLWSKRFSVARGNEWIAEREVTEENCQEWLKIFREHEPNVLFLVSKTKPKDKK